MNHATGNYVSWRKTLVPQIMSCVNVYRDKQKICHEQIYLWKTRTCSMNKATSKYLSSQQNTWIINYATGKYLVSQLNIMP